MFLKSILLLAFASAVWSQDFLQTWSNQNRFRVTPSEKPFSSLRKGVNFFFQYDGNFVVYLHGTVDTADAAWNSQTGGADCTKISCELVFQPDGNLVIYQNKVAVWNTGTFPLGDTLLISNTLPYVKVEDHQGNDLWTALRECAGLECADFLR